MVRGTFLVVEGTDRSSKDAQVAKLILRLEREGYEVVAFDFPQYEQPSSYFINEYQNGTYGSEQEVGPYTGSLFYALDRFQAAPAIRHAVQAGKVVIANRFTGSNMAHQGAKFEQSEHRRGYFIWLDNLEYEMLKIPRPDRSIVLRAPAESKQSLVEVYDDLCQLFPKDFVRIDCTRDNKLLDTDTIHTLLWQTIEPLLPPKSERQSNVATAKHNTVTMPKPGQRHSASRQQAGDLHSSKLGWGYLTVNIEQLLSDQVNEEDRHNYYVPNDLDVETKATYEETIDKIFDLHTAMVKKVTDYIRSNADTPKEVQDDAWRNRTYAEACAAVGSVLPVAARLQEKADAADLNEITTNHTSDIAQTIQRLTDQYLPDNHASESEPVNLTGVWPRNELDLVPDMLYEYSNLPLKDLEDEVTSWPISRRMDIFESYLQDRSSMGKDSSPALEKARYSWDLVCDFGTFCDLQRYSTGEDVHWQMLTPRYGYDVPKLVEDAGLTDAFEACFDLSLQLYSTLQAVGYITEAQYVTLLGHKTRWKVTYNAKEMFHLYEVRVSPHVQPNARKLMQAMHERLAEAHPMMAEAMKIPNKK